MKSFCVFFLFALLALAYGAKIDQQWAEYKVSQTDQNLKIITTINYFFFQRVFHKSYSAADETKNFEIFKKNIQDIEDSQKLSGQGRSLPKSNQKNNVFTHSL